MKFWRAISAVMLFAHLTGCQTSTMPPPPTTTPYALNAAEKTAVEKGVRASLKDPASAVFGNMVASDQGGGIKNVCGIVNAKNSFGGYTGDTAYFGVLGSMDAQGKTIATFRMTTMGSDNNSAAVVKTMCQHYGVI
ncbi:hypothetical protein [Mesorhizobium muleiense]|uniref:hypothetical protein n=1 Tax=Mesorhizobium muleiense TaxID=1004279 RepID=UPI001F2D422D|nr:hypothetical protein [Mesorhizobium muleiense]MCF6113884.1 hypothetical protein [Mesorhizobium muleiense]